MVHRNSFGAIKISDCTSHLQNPVVSPRRKAKALHSHLHQLTTRMVKSAILMKQFRIHLSIAMNTLKILIPSSLNLPCSNYSLTNNSTRLARSHISHILEWNRYNLNMDVNTSMDYRGQHFCIEIIINHMPQTWLDAASWSSIICRYCSARTRERSSGSRSSTSSSSSRALLR